MSVNQRSDNETAEAIRNLHRFLVRAAIVLVVVVTAFLFFRWVAEGDDVDAYRNCLDRVGLSQAQLCNH